MPVILEQINKPTPEDLEDLVKIYRDYPEPLSPNVETTLEHWIDHQRAKNQLLFAGRFNGRLLAAIWATRSPQGLQLDYLCVRTATRRRGVARQLLTLLTQQASREHQNLTIKGSVTTTLEPLLSDLGFSCTDQTSPHTTWILINTP